MPEERSKQVERWLIGKSEIFKSYTPEGMDFRKPETIAEFRAVYCKMDGSQFKFMTGTHAVLLQASDVLERLGLNPRFTDDKGGTILLSIIFDAPTGELL